MIALMKSLAHNYLPRVANDTAPKPSAEIKQRPKPFKTNVNQSLLEPAPKHSNDDEYAGTWSVINSLFDE